MALQVSSTSGAGPIPSFVKMGLVCAISSMNEQELPRLSPLFRKLDDGFPYLALSVSQPDRGLPNRPRSPQPFALSPTVRATPFWDILSTRSWVSSNSSTLPHITTDPWLACIVIAPSTRMSLCKFFISLMMISPYRVNHIHTQNNPTVIARTVKDIGMNEMRQRVYEVMTTCDIAIPSKLRL